MPSGTWRNPRRPTWRVALFGCVGLLAISLNAIYGGDVHRHDQFVKTFGLRPPTFFHHLDAAERERLQSEINAKIFLFDLKKSELEKFMERAQLMEGVVQGYLQVEGGNGANADFEKVEELRVAFNIFRAAVTELKEGLEQNNYERKKAAELAAWFGLTVPNPPRLLR